VSNSLANQVIDWILRSKSRRLIAGFMGMSLTIGLLTVSQKTPDVWHLWIQWPICVIFLVSAGLMLFGLVEVAFGGKIDSR
jgi:hypothetical protein